MGKWTNDALAPLKEKVSDFVGTFGFDAHNDDELTAVKPASDATSDLAIGFGVGLAIGGGVRALIAGVKKFREVRALATAERDMLRIREQEIRAGLDTEAGSPGFARKTNWQETEAYQRNKYGPEGYEAQKSFLNGTPARYGTRGSTRPDMYAPGHSIEGKNYDLSTSGGRNKLISDASRQAVHRDQNLPTGDLQTIEIDIRGQQIARQELVRIQQAISQRTGGVIKPQDVTFITH